MVQRCLDRGKGFEKERHKAVARDWEKQMQLEGCSRMGFAKDVYFSAKKIIYSYLLKIIHFCYVPFFVYVNEIQKHLFQALGWCLCKTALLKGFINSGCLYLFLRTNVC